MAVTFVLQILLSLIVGSAVFLLIYTVFRFPVEHEPPVNRQIAAAVGIRRETIFENPVVAPAMNLMRSLARRFQIHSLRERVRRDLNTCGNPSGYTVDEYLAICLATAVVLTLVAALLDLFLEGTWFLLWGPLLLVLGFYIPLFVLRSAANARAQRIQKQLPYTLDLIALTMAAGSSFSEAVGALIRDDPEDDLNQELGIAMSEIEFGTTRSQALANLAERVPLETLRSIVGAVNQAESLGSPLSSILKLQADMLRQRRSVRAEKLAASASLRILIPSMLILIGVVIIVFAPMVITYIQRGSLW